MQEESPVAVQGTFVTNPVRPPAEVATSDSAISLRQPRPQTGEERAETKDTSPEKLQERLEALQKHLEEQGAPLHFSIVHDAGRVLVEVTQRDSQKVLMRIPPEGVLQVGADGLPSLGKLLDRRY
ncbi:flagellar protein FlaG [Nitratidesulfovibrio vulgaris]|uniref:Flagellin FlaG, putative n=2 Tax=Nitratidesulfovibrio vulgaris TaxID=881 RepID=Q72C42_NITV2|nr:flagellar protein FlaG [Nitratidesulfovibrio vulgaris]GEB79174.1 flagellin [Desulfovibrio desulfuricans]HBW15873.1 flagellin [Desulfovibrio sp.]AAS95920.1 flagellin FlaG, putative [Nitratidesulfovibrio vulgaris str. Hildenborough]ABM28654.1 flagellin FlaG, putative [Nitratidesulfovibrio vulgaris DP4]ADP87000.1 hypothetical protein Deval_1849 [Nitratidesulfovibrio vulgaris RCH1]